MSRSNPKTTQIIVLGLAAAASVSLLLWYLSQKKKQHDQQLSSSNNNKKKKNQKDTQAPPPPPTPPPKNNSKLPGFADSDPTPRRTNTTTTTSPTTATTTITTDTATKTTAEALADSTATEATATTSTTNDNDTAAATTTTTTTTSSLDDKAIHAQIEELDRKGKAYFKNKQYLEAAQAFTEALEYVQKHGDTTGSSASSSSSSSPASMFRQQITLLNNRSAMYEKANINELALDDCERILELDVGHTKARMRKMRLLEVLQRYPEALCEFCAVQLQFMQANRVNLRMGLPVPNPPIPQTKMEEILSQILPHETEKYVTLLNERNNTTRQLPGHYTILQLLRSYTEYNAWMSLAAKSGSVEKLSNDLALLSADNAATVAERATLLYQRGRRYVYDRKYEEATLDFEQAYDMVHANEEAMAAMTAAKDNNLSYARLLEWTGMVRHWHYNLDSALSLLEQASELEPENALLVVKQAGVQLDAGKQDEALQLFERALTSDPESTDVLLHRSNLRIMRGEPELAKADLEKCLKLRPSHTMARLRLASILVPLEDMTGAQRQIDLAEQSEPNSSEVHSYRGELYFAQGEMDEARQQFEKAIRLEPNNPTPYVNAAVALINTPPSVAGQMPDTAKVMELLEMAIDVDPQFSAAYVHLCQLKLGTATNLVAARDVVQLYDRALENCRSPEEIKELCGMRVLAVAQVEAATMLRMESFNFQ